MYDSDADLRDFENVPLTEDVDAYFEREVRPHVPDAWSWIGARTRSATRSTSTATSTCLRHRGPLAQIDADLRKAEDEIVRLLREATTGTRDSGFIPARRDPGALGRSHGQIYSSAFRPESPWVRTTAGRRRSEYPYLRVANVPGRVYRPVGGGWPCPSKRRPPPCSALATCS